MTLILSILFFLNSHARPARAAETLETLHDLAVIIVFALAVGIGLGLYERRGGRREDVHFF